MRNLIFKFLTSELNSLKELPILLLKVVGLWLKTAYRVILSANYIRLMEFPILAKVGTVILIALATAILYYCVPPLSP